MEVIIGILVSVLGSYFYDTDFATVYMLVSMSIALYKSWINHTNDKTALQ